MAAAPRKRLAPEQRRAEILDAATRLIVQQGYLPLPLEQLGRAAGISKALIYTYFPTQYDLFNALLGRELQGLIAGGVDTASRLGNLDEAGLCCAMLYFDHVAQTGPLLHILMTDMYMAGHVAAQHTQSLQKLLRRFYRLAGNALPLTKQEIMAATEMMAAIPEEAGGLAYHQELELSVARQLCHSLISSSLQALRAPLATLDVRADDLA